jgi:DNA-binding IclR family transcriptional regulator
MPDSDTRSAAPLSVTRVLQILESIGKVDRPIGLAQLSRDLEVPKSSLAALLRGLVGANYLEFTDGAYSIGPSAFDLGSLMEKARRRFHTSDHLREGMRDLCQQAGETVLFAVLNRDDRRTMTYVDIVESRGAIRISVTIGDRRPLYCTAGGRALLSTMSDEEVRRYLDAEKLKKLTPKTEINKTKLLKLVQRARREQVSLVVDEHVQGIIGVASVIRDATNSVLGTLIIAAPSSRLADSESRLVNVGLAAAQSISRNLGYRATPVK